MKTFEQTVREVADSDVEGLIEARRLYGDSWRAEGGVSAYFNIKRKIDRFVNCLKRPLEVVPGREPRVQYDVFSHVKADLAVGGETVLDTIRDLRRYLNLAEAFLLEQGVELPLQRDNLAAAKALPQTAAPSVKPPLHFPDGVRAVVESKDLGYAHVSTETGPRGFDPALDAAGEPEQPQAAVPNIVTLTEHPAGFGTQMDRDWVRQS